MHLDGMNIVLFITDQERRVMDFPPGWAEANLPGMNRLKRHGLSFQRAFTNSCMCSPARATLLSGFFPAQHGVKYTLEQDMSEPDYPQVTMPLPNVMPNLATVVSSAGFDPIYKGKFHVTKYTGARWEIPDIGQMDSSAGTRRTPAPTRTSMRKAAARSRMMRASCISTGPMRRAWKARMRS